MPKGRHLLFVAGDPSADRHAAALVRALREKDPAIRVTAMGGSFLEKIADTFLFSLVGVGGFGFWEPLVKMPELYRAFRKIRHLLKSDKPDVVIPVDYYGFNIHVARLAHAMGIPVIYYISPQVWASRRGRINKLAAVVDKMLVLFPFEEDIYRQAGVPVTFVGHPLLERLPEPGTPVTDAPTIGLLPGSRRSVVKRHLPLLIQTAERLRKRFPEIRYILFRPEEIEEGFYAQYLNTRPWIQLEVDPDYKTRRSLWLAITVSGTSALENMLLGIPMIIMYKLSPLTYWIARQLIRVPYIGIPNLLANKLVVPEFIQDNATPERLADEVVTYLSSASRRSSIRDNLLALRATLQEGGSRRCAEEILGALS